MATFASKSVSWGGVDNTPWGLTAKVGPYKATAKDKLNFYNRKGGPNAGHADAFYTIRPGVFTPTKQPKTPGYYLNDSIIDNYDYSIQSDVPGRRGKKISFKDNFNINAHNERLAIELKNRKEAADAIRDLEEYRRNFRNMNMQTMSNVLDGSLRTNSRRDSGSNSLDSINSASSSSSSDLNPTPDQSFRENPATVVDNMELPSYSSDFALPSYSSGESLPNYSQLRITTEDLYNSMVNNQNGPSFANSLRERPLSLTGRGSAPSTTRIVDSNYQSSQGSSTIGPNSMENQNIINGLRIDTSGLNNSPSGLGPIYATSLRESPLSMSPPAYASNSPSSSDSSTISETSSRPSTLSTLPPYAPNSTSSSDSSTISATSSRPSTLSTLPPYAPNSDSSSYSDPIYATSLRQSPLSMSYRQSETNSDSSRLHSGPVYATSLRQSPLSMSARQSTTNSDSSRGLGPIYATSLRESPLPMSARQSVTNSDSSRGLGSISGEGLREFPLPMSVSQSAGSNTGGNTPRSRTSNVVVPRNQRPVHPLQAIYDRIAFPRRDSTLEEMVYPPGDRAILPFNDRRDSGYGGLTLNEGINEIEEIIEGITQVARRRPLDRLERIYLARLLELQSGIRGNDENYQFLTIHR